LRDGVCLDGSIVPIEFNTYSQGRIEVGAHTFINYGSSIAAHELVQIGANCLLGHYTFIMDNDQHDIFLHGVLPPSRPVIIEDSVWIGSHAIILPGVRIGLRSVVGAGSVVTKDVPAGCVVAGNPARVVRKLDATA
jgi:acetyltransferase-like isoleucine patch superfamily enzyme